MAVNPSATFAHVPDGPMLVVFGYLSFEDRVSLSQTCRKLRYLALNGGVISQEEHVLDSQASACLALAHRAQTLFVTSAAALHVFLVGYSWPAHTKWPITRLELSVKTGSRLLKERLGALMPSIATLCFYPRAKSLRLNSPALVVGLTRCTELLLAKGE